MDKCNTCHNRYSPDCDWNQGRCPHHQPILNTHHFRFYNLFQSIKGFFKRGN